MGGARKPDMSPERLFKDAGISQSDRDFLNQERNAELRAETLAKLTQGARSPRGLLRPSLGNKVLLPGIEEAINTARGVNYFGDTRQGLMSAPGGSLFNALATQGMGQIASGQTMNPTILKAKG